MSVGVALLSVWLFCWARLLVNERLRFSELVVAWLRAADGGVVLIA